MYGVNHLHREFHDRLDHQGNDLLNAYIDLEKPGVVGRFCVNATTIIGGKTVEIVRYDSTHGTVDMHRLYRNPPTKEHDIGKPVNLGTVKELVAEVKQNFNAWKEAYLRNYGKME